MKITYRQVPPAQFTLARLLRMNLPIITSLEIAELSNEMDRRATTFRILKDALVEKYKVKITAAQKAGEVDVSGPNPQDVDEFNARISEAIDKETPDIPTVIHLPSDIATNEDYKELRIIDPMALKPISPFLRIK